MTIIPFKPIYNPNNTNPQESTETIHLHWLGSMSYTQGVNALADNVGAYWLLDRVALNIGRLVFKKKKALHPPIQITLIVKPQKVNLFNKARLVATEAGKEGKVIYRKLITKTDFPVGRYSFWLMDKVLCLPSERP